MGRWLKWGRLSKQERGRDGGKRENKEKELNIKGHFRANIEI